MVLLGSLPIKISMTTHSPAMVLFGRTMIGRILIEEQNEEQFAKTKLKFFGRETFLDKPFLLF